MLSSYAAKGTPINRADVKAAAAALGGDEASLWALVAVETRGFGYLSNRRPQILFERHIFHKRTQGKFSAQYPGISNPVAGGYSGGAAEYDRLQQAVGLDERAALESASWGLGQVMGFNAALAGFASAEAMVSAMVAGEGAHLQALVGFITNQPPLAKAFRARDWSRVAFIYNGSNYQQNHYDEKLEQHYAVFSTAANLPDMDLRTAQACLTYIGYDTRGVDGTLGPGTKAALLAYRKKRGQAQGALDPALLQLLINDAGV
jgi:hypothetical protein